MGLVGPGCSQPRPPSAVDVFGFDPGGRVAGPQPPPGQDPGARPGTRLAAPGSRTCHRHTCEPGRTRGGVRALTSTRPKAVATLSADRSGDALKCAASVGCLVVVS